MSKKHKTPPPIDFCPETIEDLASRFSAALIPIYDAESIKKHNAIRPGEQRRHVFDFEDGLRLLISRDRFAKGEIKVHVSASLDDPCSKLGARIQAEFPYSSGRLLEFLRVAKERFLELSKLAKENHSVEFIGITDGTVPHWISE